ncbi:hypothetical protein BD309DRAFT_951696 [Dichomitus squalens]|nr:hypothetical protein BD309DRAFT_951696 [Dichomitus squalens]
MNTLTPELRDSRYVSLRDTWGLLTCFPCGMSIFCTQLWTVMDAPGLDEGSSGCVLDDDGRRRKGGGASRPRHSSPGPRAAVSACPRQRDKPSQTPSRDSTSTLRSQCKYPTPLSSDLREAGRGRPPLHWT